jgi:hypothetical protein
VWNDKRAKNLILGLHQEVVIPPHMGEVGKNTQPMVSINLVQVGLGVDDASQIFERFHQLHRATVDGGVNRQFGGTFAH